MSIKNPPPPFLNIIVQLIGVIILALIGWIGRDMQASIGDLSQDLKLSTEKLGNRIGEVEKSVAEIKGEMKYLSPNGAKRIP